MQTPNEAIIEVLVELGHQKVPPKAVCRARHAVFWPLTAENVLYMARTRVLALGKAGTCLREQGGSNGTKARNGWERLKSPTG